MSPDTPQCPYSGELSAIVPAHATRLEGTYGPVYRMPGAQGGRRLMKVLASEHAALGPRFEREAARAATLGHGALPRAGAWRALPDGLGCYDLAAAAGTPLDEAPAMPAACIRACLADLAEALGEIHAKGWVHADLRPAAMVALPDARLALQDAGLLLDAGEPRGVPGEAAYLAPELRAGGPVTPAADAYALGACAAALWTGARGSLAPGSLEQVRANDPGLAALVDALLNPEPAARPSLTTVLQRMRPAVRPKDGTAPLAPPSTLDAAMSATLIAVASQLRRGDVEGGAATLAGLRALTPLGELADRLAALEARLALAEARPAEAIQQAAPLLDSPHRTAAYQARLVAAEAAAALNRRLEAVVHARVAVAIANDWQSPHHQAEASEVLAALTQPR